MTKAQKNTIKMGEQF